MKKILKLLFLALFGGILGYILWLIIPQKEDEGEFFQEEM